METVDLQLTDEEFCVLAKLAHEKDITFNKLIEEILLEAIKEFKEATGDQLNGITTDFDSVVSSSILLSPAN